MSSQSERTEALLSRLAAADKNLQQSLSPGHVGIFLGAEVADLPQAQMIFSLVVNLSARLFPIFQKLDIVVPQDVPLTFPAPRWSAATLHDHIRLLLEAIRPPNLIWQFHQKPTDEPRCFLSIGPLPHRADGDAIYIGSNGWNLTVSPDSPVAVGSDLNPVGAYAAACFGVAEACKRFLAPLSLSVPVVPLDRPLTFSTFTYRTGESEPNPPISSAFDLGRITMVGLGAGGGAAIFTLASFYELSGQFAAIEPDVITVSNLNRYILADANDANEQAQKRKTDVVGSLLSRFPSLKTRLFCSSFGEVKKKLQTEDFRFVVAGVHSREARRELQYETPMILWDMGATHDGEFRIWRMVLGTTECMFCKHPLTDKDPEREKAAQLEREVGLSVERWLQLLKDNEPFSEADVAVIREHRRSTETRWALPEPGQRYDDWFGDQCGRLNLPAIDDEIPIPFAPVMAGVLVAGEVIKERLFPGQQLDSYYWNTLLGRFLPRHKPNRRAPTETCRFCKDNDFIEQYQRRWLKKEGGDVKYGQEPACGAPR